jgi:hypothetical protein
MANPMFLRMRYQLDRVSAGLAELAEAFSCHGGNALFSSPRGAAVAALLGLCLFACVSPQGAGAGMSESMPPQVPPMPVAADADAAALAGSGRAHLAAGNYEAAVRDLTHAAALRPADAAIMSDLGIAHDSLGHFAEAYEQRVNIMRLMRACAGRCPDHRLIEAAFMRLERRLAQP